MGAGLNVSVTYAQYVVQSEDASATVDMQVGEEYTIIVTGTFAFSGDAYARVDPAYYLFGWYPFGDYVSECDELDLDAGYYTQSGSLPPPSNYNNAIEVDFD